MPLLCPGCTSPLDPAEPQCGVCLRPRDRGEIFAGYRKLKAEQDERANRPKKRAATLALAAAAAGGLFWLERSGLIDRALKAARPSPALPPIQARPDHPAPRLGAPAAPGSLQTERPSSPSSFPAQPPASTAAAGGSDPAAGGKPAEAPAWTIHGSLFNLLDLAPAPRVKIIFQGKAGGKSHQVLTDAKGRFSAKLPPLKEGGYLVTMWDGKKELQFIEDTDISYRSFSADRRREEAADLARLPQVLHVPILLPEGRDELRHDAALLPR